MKQNMIHTPVGVRDLYGAEYLRKNQVHHKLEQTFHSFGYETIQTPTFEYFDIFSKEVGTTPSKDLYKFFDKEGNTLVLRPDFTPSIARCAVKYFMEQDLDHQLPVRLCYSGSAFSNVSELQGKFKETTQVGVESIGDATAEADAEMICLVADALQKCGFEEFTISVGNVDYFKGLCEEARLDEDTIVALREYISVKNYYGAEEMLLHRQVDPKYIQGFVQAGQITGKEELQVLKEIAPNQKARDAITRLEEIYAIVDAYGYGAYVSFDLGMLSKFHYYTGVILKAYTYGVGDAIVKGGRYDQLLSKFGKNAPAVGCVFLLDDIMSALSAQKKQPEISAKKAVVVYKKEKRAEAFAKIRELRTQGMQVSTKMIANEMEANAIMQEAEEAEPMYISFL